MRIGRTRGTLFAGGIYIDLLRAKRAPYALLGAVPQVHGQHGRLGLARADDCQLVLGGVACGRWRSGGSLVHVRMAADLPAASRQAPGGSESHVQMTAGLLMGWPGCRQASSGSAWWARMTANPSSVGSVCSQ